MMTITAFLCFAFVSLACGATVPRPDVPKPTGTLMEFREVNDSTCFLRIKVCGDSVSGFYVEHGRNMDDEKIYYAAFCQDLKFSGTAISFVLREYAWSRKPMESVQGEITREDANSGTVPMLALYRNSFWGKLEDSTLALGRYSDIYDSRTDGYIYTVSRTPCDCP